MDFSDFTEECCISLFEHWLSRDEYYKQNYSVISYEEQQKRYHQRIAFFKELISKEDFIIKNFNNKQKCTFQVIEDIDDLQGNLEKAFSREIELHFYIKRMMLIVSPWYLEDDSDIAILSTQTDKEELNRVLRKHKLFFLCNDR